MFNNVNDYKIAILGLGYVGLPLAIEFSKKYIVLGFDINRTRILDLNNGLDKTKEVSSFDLNERLNDEKKSLKFSFDENDLSDCNLYIVTVPTPINSFKIPDLKPLLSASEMIGKVLSPGNIVIFESTVYPGCTEDDCVPVLEKYSKLKFNVDFFCGYSPERINPGDKINVLSKIKKITSGSTPQIAELVDSLYNSIIVAGTHKAPSLKVAEAAKAIENAQRDLNISFMNELSLICDRLGVDTSDVIEAASTKWNFLKFKPGLVGGHCIGVDPYYLKFKAESLGYYPQVISSGRRVNDFMGSFIANKVVKLLSQKGAQVFNSNVLILGFSFKENCPDFRNTKVIDIYNELMDFNMNIDIFDPWVDLDEVKQEYGISLIKDIYITVYDIIILAVAHEEFFKLDYLALKGENCILYDIKSVIDRKFVDGRL
jgi:UDP-N-acetyl-D-galactosamine dehydrogenase